MIHWTPEMDAMLGQASDCSVARRLGISTGSVWLRRKIKGIPPYYKSKNRLDRPIVEWTPELVALLGTEPDVEIAYALGVHVSAVAHERRRRGIKPCREARILDYHQIYVDWTRNPNYAEVGRKHGLTRQGVHQAIKRYIAKLQAQSPPYKRGKKSNG